MAKVIYRLKDGTRVPRTTAITGRYKDTGGLMDWVWKQGKAGIPWRETRDAAGDKGTGVHKQIENQLRENPIPPWPGLGHITILHLEVPLVSEVYQYGGTIDAIGRDAKERYVLLDWKTTGDFYKEQMLQMAAYNHIWNENNLHKITGGTYIVRFTKSGEYVRLIAFDVPEIPECATLALAWEQFKDAVRMYGREKPLDGEMEKAKNHE